MIIVKAADVMDKWLGGSEAIIRSLFTRARSAAPCILFFDEIDAVGKREAVARRNPHVLSSCCFHLLMLLALSPL